MENKSKRSLSDKMAEKILRLIGVGRALPSKSILLERQKNELSPHIPPRFYKKHWKQNQLDGFYYYTSKNNFKEKVVVYFHGGAFINQPMIFHWKFLKKLFKKAKVKVIVPVYPKAPLYTYEDTHKFLLNVFKKLAKTYSNSKFIFMGDSAGGNLALALSQIAQKNALSKLPKPRKLILFSPALDLTLSNLEIKQIEKEKLDPMLCKKTLLKAYKYWAGNTPLQDPKISPGLGRLKGIKAIALFVGTSEILFPESKSFFEKCKKEGVKINYYERRGQLHVYPLYPTKEAKKEFEIILNEVFDC